MQFDQSFGAGSFTFGLVNRVIILKPFLEQFNKK